MFAFRPLFTDRGHDGMLLIIGDNIRFQGDSKDMGENWGYFKVEFLGESWSGLEALLGFRSLRSFLTPSSVIVTLGICGCFFLD